MEGIWSLLRIAIYKPPCIPGRGDPGGTLGPACGVGIGGGTPIIASGITAGFAVGGPIGGSGPPMGGPGGGGPGGPLGGPPGGAAGGGGGRASVMDDDMNWFSHAKKF